MKFADMRRLIAAGMIGNLLEWYDFATYKEWPTRWTLPPLALPMTHSSASASWEMEVSCAVRRSAVLPYPSRLVVTQRRRLSHAEIKGRHAAPVLHDPGTSTTGRAGSGHFVVDALK
jgi:hypothetical protein